MGQVYLSRIVTVSENHQKCHIRIFCWKYFYTFQNFFCPFENFEKLCNCYISLSNLLYKNSFKVLKSFSKAKKSWKKRKTLNDARFARKVANETSEDIFKHCALHSVYKKYVTRLWIKREQFRCGDTAEIDK